MEYLHIFRAPLLYLNFLGPNLSPSAHLSRQVPSLTIVTSASTSTTTTPPIIQTIATPIKSDLIPLNLLYGYSKYESVRMSIDGKYISYLAPWKGVQNVWIASIQDIIKRRKGMGNFTDEIVGRPVSHETERPVSDTMWMFNNRSLIYFKDRNGDENYQLVKVDVETGYEEELYGEPGVQARILWASHLKPNHIIIGLNKRDPRFHDPYLVDLTSGKMRMLFTNNGFGRIYFDNQLNPRLGRQASADAYDEYFSVRPGADPNKTDSWSLYRRVSGLDAESTKPLNFDGTGQKIFWLDSSGRDTAALTEVEFYEPQSTTRVLFADPKADVADVVFDRRNYKPVAAAAYYDIYQLTPLDKEFEQDLVLLKNAAEGQMKIVDKTNDFSRVLVAYTSDRLPVHYHIYERATRTLTPLFSTNPSLEPYSMSRMYPRQIPTRDGYQQLCYLTLPMEIDMHGTTGHPVPMVLVVHGGPWTRDYFGFSSSAQMLSNRGYAVLQCNFRASKGFGKNWLNLGDGQWAGDMHNDLLDAVEWAVDNKIAIKNKIAIMGASYGGYATLVGLTFTPEVFACGVDLVGPSSLETLLNSIPAYWAPSRIGMVNRIGGDPLNPIGATLLRSRSPLHRVQAIRKPLLIGQGANDPRVKQQESEQIVQAMKSRNLPVSYLLFPDEGHGLAKEENMVAFMSVAEHFLQQCLGGKAEPLFIPSSSSVQVIEEGNMPELTPYKEESRTSGA